MRRVLPVFVSFLWASTACTEPPKPEKASEEDLEKIEKDGVKGSPDLGPIPDGPIAKVGDVEIPNEAFRAIYDLKVKKYTDRGRDIPASADRRYRKSIAERLIYHEVLEQEAKKLGVDYDEKALQERQAQQKRGIRDWDKHLARRGETEESLEAMYVAELREKAILEHLGKLEVSEDEIKADYDKIKDNWKSDKPRVRASHILVPVGPTRQERKPGAKPPEPTEDEKKKWEAEAKAKAQELYDKVKSGDTDFAEVAKSESTGPSSAKGGDIGIFTEDRMAEEFSEAAFKLDVGEISKPVRTKFGYHVIKVTGKWPPGELPLEALEDQIVSRLQQRKLHQGRRELKDELIEKYEIVDNIKPTLGPEPERRVRRRAGKLRSPHGRAPAAARKGAQKPGEGEAEQAKSGEAEPEGDEG